MELQNIITEETAHRNGLVKVGLDCETYNSFMLDFHRESEGQSSFMPNQINNSIFYGIEVKATPREKF